ncbi:YidH family protein [Bailinhaonella thermotolerans]|uniref:DUF202 domain-containing protein n=1 Tax=Bailinhaonella thermotolerans TaxID=1070861 RepID=A0A3A4B5J4_9ACTN|nr:DUF202 domain-containing protein [Bailinhaonella thermotolerans]RJL32682.1 DUF202 domain-containing protein [Bailinhaonella thermotolerans]
MTHWTRGLLSEGTDPDPRFTLANERTFLAWIRTSLALIAGGVAVEALAEHAFGGVLRHIVAIVLTGAGAVLAASAFHRWLRTERALRRARSLPPPSAAPLLGYGVAVTALVLLVLVVGS